MKDVKPCDLLPLIRRNLAKTISDVKIQSSRLTVREIAVGTKKMSVFNLLSHGNFRNSLHACERGLEAH